jgi:hypothetical protein
VASEKASSAAAVLRRRHILDVINTDVTNPGLMQAWTFTVFTNSLSGRRPRGAAFLEGKLRLVAPVGYAL